MTTCVSVHPSLAASCFWLDISLCVCERFVSCFPILPASSIWLDHGMCSCVPFLLVVSLYWWLDFGMCLYASLSLASFHSISVYACAVPLRCFLFIYGRVCAPPLASLNTWMTCVCMYPSLLLIDSMVACICVHPFPLLFLISWIASSFKLDGCMCLCVPLPLR